MNTKRKFIITFENRNIMLEHVSAEFPLEACGLIAGIGEFAQLVIPTKNALQSQTSYQIDPQSQLRAFHRFEAEQLDLLAVYHSHPHGPELPSHTDIDEWNYPKALSLIWSKNKDNWLCKGFIMMQNSYQEIPIESHK